MNKRARSSANDDVLPDYDPNLIRAGERGKFADRYRKGTNVVLLDRDVMAAFPNSDAVNDALRLLMKIAKTTQRRPSARRAK